MITLADLRALLTAAHGPAVERVRPHAPDAVLRAYVPHRIRARVGLLGIMDELPQLRLVLDLERPEAEIDLTDPAMVFGVRVLLALSLGLDPGPMGCAVAWRTLRGAGQHAGWWLSCDEEAMYFVYESDATGDTDEIVSDVVASEPDAVKALVLAVRHVLGSTG